MNQRTILRLLTARSARGRLNALIGAGIMVAVAVAGMAGVQDLLPGGGNSVKTTIDGVPRVVDGDTLEVAGTKIRMHGMDAPESAQKCLDGSGRGYACGTRSTAHLRSLVAGGNVSCKVYDTDGYGRQVSECFTPSGESLNATMVEDGWAIAYREYSRDFVGEERQASTTGVGMWSGTFDKPWDWRKAN